MIPGLPNPWLILGAVLAFLGAAVGGYFYGGHVTKLSYEAAISKQEATASTLLAQLNATSAAKDDDNAKAARALDIEHAKGLQAIADGRAGFESELARRVRDAERRARGGCQLSSSTTVAGQSETASPGGDGGSGSTTAERLSRVRDVGLKLQADVKECWAWAAEVGR